MNSFWSTRVSSEQKLSRKNAKIFVRISQTLSLNCTFFCKNKLSLKMRNDTRFRENTMSVVAIITINCAKKTCGILSKICLIKTYRVNKGIKVYSLKTHDANPRRFIQGWRWDFYSDIKPFLIRRPVGWILSSSTLYRVVDYESILNYLAMK